VVAVALVVLLAFFASRYVGGIYRARLAAAVRQQLGAELITGAAFYRPPYGFVARDVRIVRIRAGGAPLELLHADGLSLELGAMPRQGEPVDVKRLSLNRPVLRVDRWRSRESTTSPTISSPVPPAAPTVSTSPAIVAPTQAPAQPPSSKLSQRLRLERLVITDGAIEYDRPEGGRAARIEHLNADLTEDAYPGNYQCKLAFTDPKALDGELSGILNADTLDLRISRIALMAQAKPVIAQLPLADEMLRKLIGMGIDGKLSIEGTGTVPLRNVRQAQYQLAIGASDVVLDVPRWKAEFDHGAGRLLLRSLDTHEPLKSAHPLELAIDQMQLFSGGASLRIDSGTLVVVPDEKTWKVARLVGRLEMGTRLPFSPPNSGWFFDRGGFSGPVQFTMAASGPLRVPKDSSAFDLVHHELLAYPQGITIRPQRFPLPIERVTGGPISFRAGVVSFQNLTGTYGGDTLLLRSARLTLDDPSRKICVEDLRSQVKFEEIAGTVIFRQPNPLYPGAVGKTVAQLRPTGPFVIGGGSWYALNRPAPDHPDEKLKPDYFIRLLADGGSFAASNYRISLTDLRGEATIAPLAVNIRQVEANSMGGTVWTAGLITPGKPWLYNGRAQVRDIDLRELATRLPLGEKVRQRLSGRGYADVRLSGGSTDAVQTAADKLVADGEFEILHGDFASVPTVSEVAQQVKKPEEFGTADAAGVVHIARRVATLENGAISAPLLGLQGSGTIGFNRSLNLTVVAAPLGDWRDRMRQAGVPVVGDVLGALQKILNTAQGALLYQFRVEGTLTKPAVALVPAPVLTQPIAMLFGQMLTHPPPDQLLNQVKQKGPESQPSARPASDRVVAH